jgi:GT2 family glycosyltransferase/SAM-dependent methyltransferase
MSEYQVEPVLINTENLTPPSAVEGLWQNRTNGYYMYDLPGVPQCSIMVTAYNRLPKTKYCVECILKYTQEVDYELILIDNGSDDGTLEFFQSVPYENKQIIRVTKNIGAGFPFHTVKKIFKGKYLVNIANDVYVTQDWLTNLLKCYESDLRIGFVSPVSSNVSNLQEVALKFSNFNEMQKKAAAYNRSDPSQWEERLRLISLLTIWSRPVMDIVGTFDLAFVHDFGEDDVAVRLRRVGYKLMLCRDTWVCHDHDFRHLEDKSAESYQASLTSGRAAYAGKYHGIDAWDDINNFEYALLSPLDTVHFPPQVSALCLDVRCGGPVLEIRNRLKKRGITEVESYAFTTQAKYYLDLQTVADDVKCDRMDFIQSHYADATFDVAALGEAVNTYPEPITLLQRLYNFLKPGGVLLFKVRNTDDYKTLLRAAGLGGQTDSDLPMSVAVNEVNECLKLFGAVNISVSAEQENLGANDRAYLLKILKSVNKNADNELLARLCVKDYIFKAVRGVVQ